MTRTLVILACSFATAICHAEVMQCDAERECSLVCYYPGTSARTEHVYPANEGAVDRVQVKAIGDHNLLYTAERMEGTGTIPTFQPIEAFILPRDYPCRLSPVGPTRGPGSPVASRSIDEPSGASVE